MFLINSRSHLVSSADLSLGSKSHHQNRRTFSRSYGTILPSSFTRVVSSALVFSTYPPVLVWGTDTNNLKLRGFSWKHGINHFAQNRARLTSQAMRLRIFLKSRPTRFHRTPSAGWPSLLRPPIAVISGTGILTCFPSTTPFGLALGSD